MHLEIGLLLKEIYSKASVSAFFGTKKNPALTKNALIEAYVIKGWDQKFPKTALF